jgi:hypothetical protein
MLALAAVASWLRWRASYLLGKQGGVAQWAALIVGLAASAAVFFSSEPGQPADSILALTPTANCSKGGLAKSQRGDADALRASSDLSW